MVLNQLLWMMGVSKGFLEKVISDSKPQEEQELARHKCGKEEARLWQKEQNVQILKVKKA